MCLGRYGGLVPSNTHLMALSNDLKEVGVYMLNVYSKVKAFVLLNCPHHNFYSRIIILLIDMLHKLKERE